MKQSKHIVKQNDETYEILSNDDEIKELLESKQKPGL